MIVQGERDGLGQVHGVRRCDWLCFRRSGKREAAILLTHGHDAVVWREDQSEKEERAASRTFVEKRERIRA